MSKRYSKILKSVLANIDANPLHKELRNIIIWEYNEAVNKVFLFIKERSNPYESTLPMKLYHFTSGQLVDPEISAKILEFFYKGLTEYLIFREERYLQKSKKLEETIKRFKVLQKTQLKRMTPVEFLPKKLPRKLVRHRRKLI